MGGQYSLVFYWHPWVTKCSRSRLVINSWVAFQQFYLFFFFIISQSPDGPPHATSKQLNLVWTHLCLFHSCISHMSTVHYTNHLGFSQSIYLGTLAHWILTKEVKQLNWFQTFGCPWYTHCKWASNRCGETTVTSEDVDTKGVGQAMQAYIEHLGIFRL